MEQNNKAVFKMSHASTHPADEQTNIHTNTYKPDAYKQYFSRFSRTQEKL